MARVKTKYGHALPPEEYAQLRAVTPEEIAAAESRNREIEQRERAERAARKAAREARSAAYAARVASGPSARLRALSIGESAFFERKNSTQISAVARNVSDQLARQFQTRTERCLITGALRGVRVTRIR